MNILDIGYHLLRPALFRLDAEQAHTLITGSMDRLVALPLASLLLPQPVADPRLHTSVADITFANPVGLAAGFDKDGRHVAALAALGFGFLELGTVTPQPQPGNPQPRLFRLPADKALVNRMGFNNAGAFALAERLHTLKRPLPLGVNLGKNKATPNADAASDYVRGVTILGPYADYLVVNISSPNTPGLRDLSRREPLTELLLAVQDARRRLSADLGRPAPPLFVKLSPDEDSAGLDAALGAALDAKVDGLIATNTTVSRGDLRAPQQQETGGLSGAPLQERSQAVLRHLYRATNGTLPLIGVGGISDGDSAYARICAGASLVQLYTALIYGGPTLIAQINRRLLALLQRDGHASIASAVGSHAAIGRAL